MTYVDIDRAKTAAASLRWALGNRIILPDDDGYDTARLPWNRAVDQRPLAVALPQSVDDVVDVVRAAAEAGVRVAPQSTGHGAGALSADELSRSVLVSLAGLHGVTVDPAARTATVVGGTQWRQVVEAAAPYGLTALHGSAPDISVAGYALSGGISFYGRQHGLAVNSVQAVRVVTGDGELVTASADEDPELFWALRGGSGGFGVVVELVIGLLECADVFAGMLLWDAASVAEVSQTWARWTATTPDSATTALRVMHFPSLPQLPPFLAGRSVVVIDGAILESDERADALLRPLRALQPEVDTFTRIPSCELMHMHMDPPEPSPAVSTHAMLREFPEDAVVTLVEQAMTARPMITEVRQAGAALGVRPAHGGAVASIGGAYTLSAYAMVPTPQVKAHSAVAVHAVVDALADWHADSLAPTFIDEPDADRRLTFGASLERLADLKRRYDPDGMFTASHPVG